MKGLDEYTDRHNLRAQPWLDDVLLRIGGKDCSAKVIIGYMSEKQMLLYGIIDFKRENLTIKKKAHQTTGEKKVIRSGMLFENRGPQLINAQSPNVTPKNGSGDSSSDTLSQSNSSVNNNSAKNSFQKPKFSYGGVTAKTNNTEKLDEASACCISSDSR